MTTDFNDEVNKIFMKLKLIPNPQVVERLKESTYKKLVEQIQKVEKVDFDLNEFEYLFNPKYERYVRTPKVLIGKVYNEGHECSFNCICGVKLKYLFYIRNLKSKRIYQVGSTCIWNFLWGEQVECRTCNQNFKVNKESDIYDFLCPNCIKIIEVKVDKLKRRNKELLDENRELIKENKLLSKFDQEKLLNTELIEGCYKGQTIKNLYNDLAKKHNDLEKKYDDLEKSMMI